MSYILADNILSPLGRTSQDNARAVREGRSVLCPHEKGTREMDAPFCASLFTDEESRAFALNGLSRFEALAVSSARAALKNAPFDVSGADVLLVVSTTKGNVELLTEQTEDFTENYLGRSAERIATTLGITTTPLTVCNACISGLAALITADRLVCCGRYRYAVVVGAESQSRFIVSGFASLQALSSEPCRPFDMERNGLNLGEAAATIVLSSEATTEGQWQIVYGAVRNDAYQTVAPSKTGEGAYRALQSVVGNNDSAPVGFVSAHGTATLFNDQMEAVALRRAGLTDVPVCGVKGTYGHTMGAAGVLETILAMRSADEGVVYGTRGFEELGVSGNLKFSAQSQLIASRSFVKMLSGFGGCNAAAFFRKSTEADESDFSEKENRFSEEKPHSPKSEKRWDETALAVTHHVHLTPHSVEVDGETQEATTMGDALLTELYKTKIGGYARFYKMDALCRLGFIAAELLLQAEGETRFEARDDRAVILFGRASSLASDKKYLHSLADTENYQPGPSVFVYTLPNIVTGEIAVRNLYHGETSYYALGRKDEAQMREVALSALIDTATQSILCGWVDYEDAAHFEADLCLVQRT